MNYAVLQKTLEIPDVEKLKAAFTGIPGLTAADAAILAKDAFGVLVKGKSQEVAGKLSGTLRAHGIETLVVPESELPVLPPTKFLRRLECQTQGLVIYDAIGRPFTVEWRHVSLIAIGNVLTTEFKRTTAAPLTDTLTECDSNTLGLVDLAVGMPVDIKLGFSPHSTGFSTTRTRFGSREEPNYQLVLEILLGRAAARFTCEFEKTSPLLFLYLGTRHTKDFTANLTLLVQDLCRFAPQAAVNRGAYLLRENTGELFAYPSKHAFHEEITWILWQFSKAASAA